MCSAQNVVFGSTLSPPRLDQIVRCVDEYFSEVDVNNDPYFQWHLPHLHAALQIDVCLSDPSVSTVEMMLNII